MKPQICVLGTIKNSVKTTKTGKSGILAEIASRTSATAVSEEHSFLLQQSIATANNTSVHEEKVLKLSSTKGKKFENLWNFRWTTL